MTAAQPNTQPTAQHSHAQHNQAQHSYEQHSYEQHSHAQHSQQCPNCGHQVVLTAEPRDVPNTAGRVKVHARSESSILARAKTAQDRATDKITAFAGSLQFVYIHSAWFVLWIVVNAGLIGAGVEFDSYPFGLLTLIVSLEAIFLSTFVMVSQNRQSARADVRAELDFETNLRSEIWTLHIGRKLGLDPHEIEGHVRDVLTKTNESLTSSGASVDPLTADPSLTG